MMYSDIRWIADLVNTGKITVDQAREIANAETIEILYAYNEPCIILIRNDGEPTKEIGLYSEDYETHKLEMVKVNATLQDVVERDQERDIPSEPMYWLHRLAFIFKRCFDWLLNLIMEVFT